MNRQFGAFTGIAMVLIVLNHSIALGLDYMGVKGFPLITSWGHYILSFLQILGLYGVPIFYFISGSFVAYAAQGDPPRLSRKFIFSSLRHIIIPYLIWSVIFYILVIYQYNERYSLLQFIKNLIVGYPYHFIPLLVFYYLVAPFLVIIGYRYAGALLLIIGIYQLFSINVVSPGTFGFSFPEWTRLLTLPILRTTIADWAIYFPLGLVYGLHTKRILPWLKRYIWVFLLGIILMVILALLYIFKVIESQIGRYVFALPLILALPAISRNQIPFVRTFEKIGKRSYGLYLTHLIVIDLALLLIGLVIPWLLGIPLLLFPLLYILGLLVPMGIMGLAARGPVRRVYRYIFG